MVINSGHSFIHTPAGHLLLTVSVPRECDLSSNGSLQVDCWLATSAERSASTSSSQMCVNFIFKLSKSNILLPYCTSS